MTTATKSSEARDLYSPVMAEITGITRMTELETLYEITLPGGEDLGHGPGQFVEVSLFGVGEAPFSVSSSPTQKGVFEMGIRKVGMLTEVMERMQPGEKVGIRGPFGGGVPIEQFKGHDVLILAGGIGLVPMRSMINYVIDNRKDFGRLVICYGSRTDKELLFTEELKMWKENADVELYVTVDHCSSDWTGNTGVITTLIPGLDLDLANTRALICGPPIMYRFALLSLQSKGLPQENIYMSLERRMKCGVGKCGHCQINSSYVCQDGPVYHYPVLKDLQEAL